ncbi:MAG TPA: tetratricopeptide repeat protein [Bacteroidetes bacterium]|nr:tetratricopeptide repeat protein [Bacteroidota bacterium]
MCSPKKIRRYMWKNDLSFCLCRSLILLLMVLAGLVRPAAVFPQERNDALIRGMLEMERSKYGRALDELARAEEAGTELAQVFRLRARACMALNRMDEAAGELEKLESLDPVRAAYEWARYYALTGNDSLAVTSLRTYLGFRDKLPRKEIMTDEAFRRLERTRLWVSLWQTDWYGEAGEVLTEAEYLYSRGIYSEALQVADDAIRQGMDDARLYLVRARCHEHLSNNRAASGDYTTALAKSGGKSSFFRERGLFYFRTGDLSSALNDLNRAVSADPHDLSLMIDRAGVLASMGRYDQAKNDYDAVLLFRENDTELIRKAGRTMLEAGQALKALEYFNRNLDLDRSRPELFIDRAEAYMATQTWKNAYEDFSQALDLDPNIGRVYLNRGKVRLSMNDPEGACYDWNRAARMGEREAVLLLQQHCR